MMRDALPVAPWTLERSSKRRKPLCGRCSSRYGQGHKPAGGCFDPNPLPHCATIAIPKPGPDRTRQSRKLNRRWAKITPHLMSDVGCWNTRQKKKRNPEQRIAFQTDGHSVFRAIHLKFKGESRWNFSVCPTVSSTFEMVGIIFGEDKRHFVPGELPTYACRPLKGENAARGIVDLDEPSWF